MPEIKVGRTSFNSEALKDKKLEDVTKELSNFEPKIVKKAWQLANKKK